MASSNRCQGQCHVSENRELVNIIVTFVLSMTSNAYLSSVNVFFILLLFSAPTCIVCSVIKFS